MKQVLNITMCPGIYCELDKKDLIKRKFESKTGRATYRSICNRHAGVLFQRKTTCDECGKSFYFGISGTVPVYCQPCRKKKHVENCSKNNNKRKNARERVIKNKFKCLNYDEFCKGNICIRPMFPCKMFRMAA